LANRSPYEILHGEKPDLSHLRRFGCSANRLIPKEQQEGKFSPRSRECIMIGYVHNTSKIWRLWDPKFRRIVCSSDVIFDESRIPGDPRHGPGSDVLKDCLPDTDLMDSDEIDTIAIQAEEDRLAAAKTLMTPGAGKAIPVTSVTQPNKVLSTEKIINRKNTAIIQHQSSNTTTNPIQIPSDSVTNAGSSDEGVRNGRAVDDDDKSSRAADGDGDAELHVDSLSRDALVSVERSLPRPSRVCFLGVAYFPADCRRL
jgi:hypothetical protein